MQDKNIFRSDYLMYQGLQFWENMARQYLLFKVMFTEKKLSIILKDNWIKKKNIFHMINQLAMLMKLSFYSILKFILIISRHCFTYIRKYID